ncbi:MAG: type II toxin-antitoxin system HicA family toxin [Gammaproteobacteria bacterium]|nr:type II toxin-antitoxin system HicA family toxin [Gammaproteobacteria bacterium]MDE0511101.1 type II toxin-antitoxin system HicA family toxin [Gammaproteobacteria bacterium]
MKRKDLIRRLADNGCSLKRHGRKHDIYINPRNGRQAPVPRHQEVKNNLCKLISQQLGIST